MYDPLAQFYEEVFPVSESQTRFIASFLEKSSAAGIPAPVEENQTPLTDTQAYPKYAGTGTNSYGGGTTGEGCNEYRGRPSLRLLDVGCAVGDLGAAIAAKGVEVDAIDVNPSMIRRARERHKQTMSTVTGNLAPLRFYEMDMLEIAHHFPPKTYDALCCLGNTLVHLPGPAEIEHFLRAAAFLLRTGAKAGRKDNFRSVVRNGGGHDEVPADAMSKGARPGTLILQILNYDHLLEKRPEVLPPMETERLRFERRYGYPTDADGHITFSTRLHIKASGEMYQDSVELYPLRRAELEVLLKRAGFEELRFYGGFDGSPLQPDSFPLIVVAEPGG